MTIVGLGNSAAEMIVQFQELNRRGFNIDYRVFTHYTKEALANPDEDVDGYRLFRDLSIPDLVGLTGDLAPIAAAYWRAMAEGRIFSDVSHWRRRDDKFLCKRGGEAFTYPSDVHYTLIGFVNSPERLKELGIEVGPHGPLYDYDGEFHSNSSGSLHQGYFGLGAILETDWNRNAVVLPGIIHQMYDQAFSVMLRIFDKGR